MKRIFIVCIVLTLVSCRATIKRSSTTALKYTTMPDGSGSQADIRGTWKSVGNGYYLDVQHDSLLLYSFTSSYCYKEKNDYLEGLLNSQSQFRLRGDTLDLYLTDYGTQTSRLQTKKVFVRTEGLPAECITFAAMTELEDEQQLQLYMETMVEHFAFASDKHLDWDSLYAMAQQQLGTGEKSLFEAMGDIATATKDQHTKVINSSGQSRQYRITPSALDVQAAFEAQSEVEDLNEYFGLFFQSNRDNISDSLLMGKGTKVLNDNIEWGMLEGNVGYIQISSFAGFLGREYTRNQQIDSITAHMSSIMDTLRNARAMLVDISFNFGGYDASVLSIAAFFAEEKTLAFKSEVYDKGSFYEEDQVFVYPVERPFTKPVFVVMSDISRSAAESFAMAMSALPQVSLVGTSTLGTLSGMLGKSVSDFYTTYSNQRLVNKHGRYFEGRGVPPDSPMVLFPRESVMTGHMKVVREILQLVEEENDQ